MTTTLIIPGLNSSGPAHWQSWFEEHIPGTVRVIQADWSKPDLAAWSARIRRNITRTPGRLLIVAHSFGALPAAQAASDHSDRIAGALLVAPADPDKFGIGEHLPQTRLSFRSVVVGSTNDPWITLDRAAHWADIWGSDFVNLGNAGHINVDSGFGPWPEGLSLLERLRRAAERSDEAKREAQSRRTRTLSARRPAGPSRLSQASTRSIDDRQHLQRAAALLEEAGWHVSPPRQRVGSVIGEICQ
ncbi:MAG: RBBP9/YdeN family alpha/beta hydrolase [Hyphomicrobium sp.]